MFICFFAVRGMDVSSMFDTPKNGPLIVRLVRVMHKRAIIARIIYALEKTIYGFKIYYLRLGKTIYGSAT